MVLAGIDRGTLEIEVRLRTGSRREQRTVATDAALIHVIAQLARAGICLDEPRALLLHSSDPVTDTDDDEPSR